MTPRHGLPLALAAFCVPLLAAQPVPVSADFDDGEDVLAVTTATRSDGLSDVPTVGEFVPGYEASAWWGIGTPTNTPGEIVDKLNKEINAAVADPRMKARFADLAFTVLPGSPAEFGQFIAEDTEKWRKVVKFAGLKAE